jgi:hypothetical protein
MEDTMAAQDQYNEAFKQTQDTLLSALDAWTHAFQQGLSQLPGSVPVDPTQVIDQVFDFADTVLKVQRDFAKQLVTSSTATAEALRSGAK